MIRAETPNLWEIRVQLGHAPAIAIIVKALIHAAKLVNLDRNLSDEQIGEAANDILEIYGYFKVEEVKFLLKRALRSEQIYARLDYNTIMLWFKQYDAERTEEAMRISDEQPEPVPSDDRRIDFPTYFAMLTERAKSDLQAAEKLKLAREYLNRPKAKSREQRQQAERDFQKWRQFEYLTKLKNNKS